MKILVIPNRGRSYSAVRPEAQCYIALTELGHDVTVMSNADNAYIDEYKNSKVTFIELVTLKKWLCCS